ncbi:uncharacterized protein DUF805 [Bradyrhizobium macuxiense]|uniref:Uncharacterized protein DUF805 n=2 Tax=Bradyrhizobium macuxiense TaxID=1755647 RepID=A0A560M0N1_9BRAD|nr:DUF805 domain-containing protein [Bradyrhizobium macuxiense]TWC01207.1 uncharacterized protein DUF805 [Bradyrhizobium macuxiense]
MHAAASIATCFRKYADFSGRASRAEFWWFFGFCLLVLLAAYPFDKTIYAVIAMALPLLAVTARRFHDSGLTTGVAAFFALAPFAIFYFFAAIQDRVEAWFGVHVPYGLVAAVPAICAFGLFGLGFFFALIRRSHATNPAALSEALQENPAVAARQEAEHRVSGFSKAVMATFAIQPDGGTQAADKANKSAPAVTAACDIIVDLCARYGHGIYSPPFDALFSGAGTRLEVAGWRVLPEGGGEMDLNRRASANVLRHHAVELRKDAGQADIDGLLRKEKEQLRAAETAPEEHRTKAYYTLDGADANSFIAIEKLSEGYNTYLRIRLCFAEGHELAAMEALRSSTLYQAFRYSFSDGPQPYPAFGQRIVKGYQPILARDGLAISLDATELGAGSARMLADRGLQLPPVYVDFEMDERMM